jgi:hypothetical protein
MNVDSIGILLDAIGVLVLARGSIHFTGLSENGYIQARTPGKYRIWVPLGFALLFVGFALQFFGSLI